MKKALLRLLIVGVFTVPTVRLMPQAYAAAKKKSPDYGWVLPVIAILGGLGILWIGHTQKKKWEKDQADRAQREAEEASRRASPPVFNSGGHFGNSPGTDVVRSGNTPMSGPPGTEPAGKESTMGPSQPEKFSDVLVKNAAGLTQATFKNLDTLEKQPEVSARDPKNTNPYPDSSNWATNYHIYWAMKNADCDMSAFQQQNAVHTPKGWHEFFKQPNRAKHWRSILQAPVPTEALLQKDNLNRLPPGCVVVYDCSDEELMNSPVVEVVSPAPNYPPLTGNTGLIGHMNGLGGTLRKEDRCSKVAAVYQPTTDACQDPTPGVAK